MANTNKQINILVEFEKRYQGDPAETMRIVNEMAFDFCMDAEELADKIYLNRYEVEEVMMDYGDDYDEEIVWVGNEDFGGDEDNE